MSRRTLPLAVVAVLAAACASTPAPAPAAPDSAAVAIAIVTTEPGDVTWGRPGTVYFVRVEEGGDPFRAEELLPSNHVHAGVAYLLDAEPGRYAAVACREKKNGRELTTQLPAAMIERTLTVVEPGALGFLGSFEVEKTLYRGSEDEAQRHYASLLEPNWSTASLATRVFARSRYFMGKDFRARTDAAREQADARAYLATGGWSLRG